ncbi:MAG: FGGY-family carbohydrate kinase [Spirochaetes bacterium]|nr:FGGY-family carbohydrate kinase [Spirochaetota bacterium]
MKDLLLGIDIGTTGTKSALFSFEGDLCGSGKKEYGVEHPQPGWAQQDPLMLWEACCDSVKAALTEAGGIEAGRRIASVSVSSQGPTMLPLDRTGAPLRPALIWMDRRAEKEARAIEKRFGYRRIVDWTGNRPDPYFVAAKLLWFKENEPDLFRRTSLFMQINGYVTYRLTGVSTLDNTQAALLQLMNWKTGGWNKELCEMCGVGPDRFPPVSFGDRLQGEVTHKASELTGIPSGTPVVTGTVDGAAAAIEAGTVEAGVISEMTGTSTVLLMPNTGGIVEPAFVAMPHSVQGLSLLLGTIQATGASLRWYKTEFGVYEAEKAEAEGMDPYDCLTREAESSPAGSGGVIFLPYLMGERAPIWHTQARGVFFGLSLSTERGDVIRSILEGTAFALLHNLEVARMRGIETSELRSVGGGSRSELWCKIKADVLGLPVLLPKTSVGAVFGDAVLAGLGIGVYTDMAGFVKEAVRIEKEYLPDRGNTERYRELYELYRRIYENLKEVFDDAALLSLEYRPVKD